MAANASVLVDKATSDLLIGPDWGMNLEICDVINADPGQARDVVKAVKKRLNNKSPRVQLLALTVLETLMKNCGECVHQNVAEKEVLPEMVKIVRRKSDMAVRDKILVLLDSWQEAFGGFSSKYPQYYMAYEDLRRGGVEFPERTAETAVPMFTPSPTYPPPSYQHPGHTSHYQHPSYGLHPPTYQQPGYGLHQPTSYGSPPYPPARLDAVMTATDGPLWGTKDMDAARSGMEVLNEMLNAIDAGDKQALKDDVIVQLVKQCQSYQKNILHLVNNTSDETLLFQGLALNDELQRTLAKHDAIASGSPIPHESKRSSPKTFSAYDQEDEDAEDEFSQLAHRQSSRSGQGASANKETGPPSAAQFALPPPPQPIRRMNSRLDAQGRPVDLLSGLSINDVASPKTPGTLPSASPLSQQTTSPLSDQLNPFADSPSFVATPQPQAARQPPMPPVTLDHQQYPQSQFLQQSSPIGYVVPWATSGSPAQQEGSQQQQQQEGGASSMLQQNMSNPYGGSHQLQGVQMSAGNWSSYGANNTVQTNQTGQRPPWSAPMSLEQKTMSPSLQDSSSNQRMHDTPIGKLVQSPSGSSSAGNPPPTKSSSEGANPADKWFEDLVDLSSVSANFKKAGLTSSLSRPNASKAGGM